MALVYKFRIVLRTSVDVALEWTRKLTVIISNSTGYWNNNCLSNYSLHTFSWCFIDTFL